MSTATVTSPWTLTTGRAHRWATFRAVHCWQGIFWLHLIFRREHSVQLRGARCVVRIEAISPLQLTRVLSYQAVYTTKQVLGCAVRIATVGNMSPPHYRLPGFFSAIHIQPRNIQVKPLRQWDGCPLSYSARPSSPVRSRSGAASTPHFRYFGIPQRTVLRKALRR